MQSLVFWLSFGTSAGRLLVSAPFDCLACPGPSPRSDPNSEAAKNQTGASEVSAPVPKPSEAEGSPASVSFDGFQAPCRLSSSPVALFPFFFGKGSPLDSTNQGRSLQPLACLGRELWACSLTCRPLPAMPVIPRAHTIYYMIGCPNSTINMFYRDYFVLLFSRPVFIICSLKMLI